MILADKIIELRKKNGWSQEDLAEKLGVSRQSISKWEGAQSIPDMNKIIMMSDIFGVSTDFLLKDELEMDSTGEEIQVIDNGSDDDQCELKNVSMEEATAFLEAKEKSSRKISVGVLLCILSPIALIVLGALSELKLIQMSEEMAAGAGLVALFMLIGPAVALFILSYMSMNKYEYMETELIETAYGVDGMVKTRRDRFHDAYVKMMTIGIVLCVVSVLPIFITMMMVGDDKVGINGAYYAGAVGLLLLLVALGVFLIVRASVIQGGYQMLLEEGDYTRKSKVNTKKNSKLTSGYWMIVTAIYLAYSFITNAWYQSWIIWPVAGVLYGVVIIIADTLRKK